MSYLRSIVAALRANPIRTVAIIRSVVAIGLAFGLPRTPEQQQAILVLAAILFAVDEGVRSQVTPTSSPNLAVGTVVETPSGASAVVVPATPSAIVGAIPEIDDPDS